MLKHLGGIGDYNIENVTICILCRPVLFRCDRATEWLQPRNDPKFGKIFLQQMQYSERHPLIVCYVYVIRLVANLSASHLMASQHFTIDVLLPLLLFPNIMLALSHGRCALSHLFCSSFYYHPKVLIHSATCQKRLFSMCLEKFYHFQLSTYLPLFCQA